MEKNNNSINNYIPLDVSKYNISIVKDEEVTPYLKEQFFKLIIIGDIGTGKSSIINSLVKEIKPDFIIVIDALKASSVNRINKTIQLTDAGISPGSGIGNNRKELSKDVLGIPVFAVGVPTVVDTITIVNDSVKYITNYYSYMKNNISNPSEKLKI